MPDKNEINIITTPYVDGTIHQEMFSDFADIAKRTTLWVANTRDIGIKMALKKLGWTSPEDTLAMKNKIERLEKELDA